MTPQAQTLPSRKVLDLAAVKRMAAAAEAEALKNNWNVVIAIVDSGGHLLYLQRMDDVQIASTEIAQMKARTAVFYKRPSKAFEERIAAGGAGTGSLLLPGILPSEGGLPILVEGTVIGAIGVSGVQSAQDGQVAKAGLDALLAPASR